MPDVAIVLGPVLALIHCGLLGLAVRQAFRRRPGSGWLVLLPGLGLLAELARVLPASLSITAYLYSAALIVIGMLTFDVFKRAGGRWWLAGSGLWWLALLGVDVLDGSLLLGALDWTGIAFVEFPPVPVGGLALGWLAAGGLLVLLTVDSLYRARLPEVANRALFWLMVLAAVLLGVLLAASGTVLLAELGHIAMLVGIVGAVWAKTTLQIFDVRRLLLTSASLLVTVLLTALVVAVALVFVGIQAADAGVSPLLVGALALAVALIVVPVRYLGVWLTTQTSAPEVFMARGLRQYSQQVTAAIELEQVAQLAQHTVLTVLQVRSSAVLLATALDDGGRVLERIGGAHQVMLEADSPVLARLFDLQTPLSQFDLEFDTAFEALSASEREAFEALRMSAYAPIVIDGQVIAVLAGGPRINDKPYTGSDVELLVAIANQTGTALRNARLMAELRQANQEMARLDTVKTDFITIASHELRTPLAQIRGYTDIIETSVGQAVSDMDDLTVLIENLRRASGRMEALIGNMLDVSRLDVDALDLHYVTVTLDAVFRLALEPLTDALRLRQIGLTARGLRALPPLEADLQRLVQAFGNVLGNAVKYTPDGGDIEVQGTLEDARGEVQQIHVTIRDTGIGIAPENQALVFEKFFRVGDPGLHSTGETKFMGAGPGLGLTIARGVIEGHGGRIWLESAGHDPVSLPGVAVHIVLPLEPPESLRQVSPFEVTRTSVTSVEREQLKAAVEATLRGQTANGDATPPVIPRVTS